MLLGQKWGPLASLHSLFTWGLYSSRCKICPECLPFSPLYRRLDRKEGPFVGDVSRPWFVSKEKDMLSPFSWAIRWEAAKIFSRCSRLLLNTLLLEFFADLRHLPAVLILFQKWPFNSPLARLIILKLEGIQLHHQRAKEGDEKTLHFFGSLL